MEANTKKPNKVRDKPRFPASLGYENDFQQAYASTIGTMMEAVIAKVKSYAEHSTDQTD